MRGCLTQADAVYRQNNFDDWDSKIKHLERFPFHKNQHLTVRTTTHIDIGCHCTILIKAGSLRTRGSERVSTFEVVLIAKPVGRETSSNRQYEYQLTDRAVAFARVSLQC